MKPNRVLLPNIPALFAICLSLLAPAACFGHSATMTPQYEMSMGDYYMKRHDWANAAHCYRQVIEMGYRNADAHSRLGFVELYRGELQKAAEEFTAALNITPHLSDAERGLDLSLSNDAARNDYFQKVQDIVQKEPNNADAHATFAEQLLERGMTDEAEKEAETALQLSPHLGHADCVLGRIAFGRSDEKDASNYLRIAVSEDQNDDDAWATLGDIAMKNRAYALAISDYHHAVQAAPEHADWYKKLAVAYTSVGDSRSAAREIAAMQQLPLIPKAPL